MIDHPTPPEDIMAFNYASKIQALLANADDDSLSDNTRQAYRDKAEQLMRDYRIAEEDALATDPGSVKPVWSKVRITNVNTSHDMWQWLHTVWAVIASHAGVKYTSQSDDKGDYKHVVGYEGDVRYAEYLWTAALLMFSTRVDPHWDDTLPESENIWRLRNAGIERRVIADRAWGKGSGQNAANRSKVQRIYLRESAARNEVARATGLGHQTDVYRYNYADGFVAQLSRRLRNARDAVDRTGGAIEMHGRSDRVDEALYERYPHLRPQAEPSPYVYVPCAKCTDERACRDHYITKATQARYDRYSRGPSAESGKRAGRHAANGVDLVRGASGDRSNHVTEANDHAIGS